MPLAQRQDDFTFSGVLSGEILDTLIFEDTSSLTLEYDERKQQLRDIIWSMVPEAPSWDSEPVTVTAKSAETAERFLRRLPPNRELPKVAPDGEGNLFFVWEPPHGNCIITVEPDQLHMVDQPGT